MKSEDYHDYVIKDGKFIGKFEEMYKNVEDPWLHGNALAPQYDTALSLISKYGICSDGGRILDIGCGKGAFTSRLRKTLPKADITALDISKTAIKKAIEQYGSMDIDFKIFDIQKDYKNIEGQFDVIIMSEIMWYILPSLKDVLSHLSSKTLKPGGYILMNQAFYKPGIQKYGNEIVEKPEDLVKLANMKLIERVDIDKKNDFDSVMLFQKNLF